MTLSSGVRGLVMWDMFCYTPWSAPQNRCQDLQIGLAEASGSYLGIPDSSPAKIQAQNYFLKLFFECSDCASARFIFSPFYFTLRSHLPFYFQNKFNDEIRE
jgi:hypothetical protein